jgi:hypothetical protein
VFITVVTEKSREGTLLDNTLPCSEFSASFYDRSYCGSINKAVSIDMPWSTATHFAFLQKSAKLPTTLARVRVKNVIVRVPKKHIVSQITNRN